MQILCAFILILQISHSISAMTLNEALLSLEDHKLVQSQLDTAKGLKEFSQAQGSWGDPKLTISAMNFPRETLSRDDSMMTGIQIGLSQKIALSNKYGLAKEAYKDKAQVKQYVGKQYQRELAYALWEMAIEQTRLKEVEKILNENLGWLESNLKISKQLYRNGKIPQQAILDIQIRRGRLKGQIINISHSISSLHYKLASLLGVQEINELIVSSDDWTFLEKMKKELETRGDQAVENDFELEKLKHNVKYSETQLKVKERNFIPDLQIGLNYTKRNDRDGLGDFVGASVSFDLPTSDMRYAQRSEAYYQKLSAHKELQHYQLSKPHRLRQIDNDIADILEQLHILRKSTLQFAKTSREVSAKSYARGQTDYLKLLSSELQYQNQRIEEIGLKAKLRRARAMYLLVKGARLQKEIK